MAAIEHRCLRIQRKDGLCYDAVRDWTRGREQQICSGVPFAGQVAESG